MAVDRWPETGQFFLLGEDRYPFLEFVDAPLDRQLPFLVGGGHVAAHQLVEPVEEVSGIAYIATYRRVGPAQFEGVGSEVKEDQLAHVVDHFTRVAQGLEAFPGHPGSHHLVMMEAHPVGSELAGIGFSDVVEQRSEPQHKVRRGLVDHGEGVGQHVLMPLLGVLLHSQAGQLWKEVVGQPRFDDHPERSAGPGRHHELRQLVADPLRRDDLQPLAHPGHRLQGFFVGSELQRRLEAEQPQHSQRVVREGDLRL